MSENCEKIKDRITKLNDDIWGFLGVVESGEKDPRELMVVKDEIKESIEALMLEESLMMWTYMRHPELATKSAIEQRVNKIVKTKKLKFWKIGVLSDGTVFVQLTGHVAGLRGLLKEDANMVSKLELLDSEMAQLPLIVLDELFKEPTCIVKVLTFKLSSKMFMDSVESMLIGFNARNIRLREIIMLNTDIIDKETKDRWIEKCNNNGIQLICS